MTTDNQKKEHAMPEKEDRAKIVPRRVLHIFERTPRKLHYRIQVVEAWHREGIELVHLGQAVNTLMERGPEKMMKRVLYGEINEKEAMAYFRDLRDSIHHLKERVEAIATVLDLQKVLLVDRPGPKSKSPITRNKQPLLEKESKNPGVEKGPHHE